MTTSSESYVGIDVSKDRLDMAGLGERQEKQVTNTQEGTLGGMDAGDAT